jgi:AbrB family looped-hinge helix DNA binding protein
MPSATITSKGQLTLPKAMRDLLRLGAGDRVDFIVRDDRPAEPGAGAAETATFDRSLRGSNASASCDRGATTRSAAGSNRSAGLPRRVSTPGDDPRLPGCHSRSVARRLIVPAPL